MAGNLDHLAQLQHMIAVQSNPFEKARLAGLALDMVIEILGDQQKQIRALERTANGTQSG